MAEQQVSSEQPLAVDIDALLDEPSEQMQQLRLLQQTRGFSAPPPAPVSSSLPTFQSMDMRVPSGSPHAVHAKSPAHHQQEFGRQPWPRSLGEVLVADEEVNQHEGTLGATLREFLQPQNSRGSIKYPTSPSDRFSHDSFSPRPRTSPSGSPNEVWKVSPADSKASASPSFNLASLRHSSSSDHLNSGSNFRNSSENMAGSAGANVAQTMQHNQFFPSAVNYDTQSPTNSSYDAHFHRLDSGQMHLQGSQSFDARAPTHSLSSSPSNSKGLSRSSQELHHSIQVTTPTSPSHQSLTSLMAVGSAGPLSPTHFNSSGMRLFGTQNQQSQGDGANYAHSPSTSSPRSFSHSTVASSFAVLGHSNSHENLSLQTIGMLMKSSSSNSPPVEQTFSPKSGGSGASSNTFQSPPRASFDNVATSPHSQVTPRSGSFSPTAVSGATSTFVELQQLQLQQTFVVDIVHDSHSVADGSSFESQQHHIQSQQRSEQQVQQQPPPPTQPSPPPQQQQHQQQHQYQRRQHQQQQQQQRQHPHQSVLHQYHHQQQYQQPHFHHQQQLLQHQQQHQSLQQQQQYYQQNFSQYQGSGYQHHTNFPSYPSIPRVMMVLVDEHNNVIPQSLTPNFNAQYSQFVHPMPGVIQVPDFDIAGSTFSTHGHYEGMFHGQMAPHQSSDQQSRQQRSPGSAVNVSLGQSQSLATTSQISSQMLQNQAHITKSSPQSGTFIATQQRSGGKQPQQSVESPLRPPPASRPGHPISSITKYTPGSDRVIDVALDQQGSRLIQARLGVSPPAVVAAIVDEIISDLNVLTLDVFGNYVVQKAFEYTDLVHQQRVASILGGKIVDLSMHVYGCRVVQKILEVFDSQFHSFIVSELLEQLKECVCDPNGNHVVQKAVERASAVLLQPVVDILGQDVFLFATHLYGCRVMQRVLEYCISEQSAPILQLIVESGSELLRDQYGNYVVQHVIECGPASARSSLLKLMCGDLPELAVHKFASNVVEKVLRSSSPTEVVPLIAEFLTPKRPGAPVPLQTVMRDQFGNYVIQCIIDISQGEQREAIAAFVLSEKEELKKYSYGKHILSHLEKTMPDSSKAQPRVWNKPSKAKGGGSR